MPASTLASGGGRGRPGEQPYRLAHLLRNIGGRPGRGSGASARPAGSAAAAPVPGSRLPARSSRGRSACSHVPFESPGHLRHPGVTVNSAPRQALRQICQARQERPASVMRVGGKDQSEFDDPAFLAMLRQGDQRAYQRLIRRFHGSLVGVAAAIIGSHAQGEEVVQDAWLAVHAGIGRFEGRSSLITWVFSIVLNRARTRASREARTVGLPDMADGGEPGERAVPLSAFQPDGHWVEAPRLWDEVSPERIVGGRQLWDHVLAGDRTPAGCPARRADPARHRATRGRGGVRAAGDQRGKPARAAAPGARPHSCDDRHVDRCRAGNGVACRAGPANRAGARTRSRAASPPRCVCWPGRSGLHNTHSTRRSYSEHRNQVQT